MAPQPQIYGIYRIWSLLLYFIDKLAQHRNTNSLSFFLVNKAITNLIIDIQGTIDIGKISENLIEIRAKPAMFGPIVVLHSPSVFNDDFHLMNVLASQSRIKRGRILSEVPSDEKICKYLSPDQVSLIDSLANFYSKFSSEELAILATNRNARDTRIYVSYEIQAWMRRCSQLVSILEIINTKGTVSPVDKKDIEQAVTGLLVLTNQARTKIRNYLEEIPGIKRKISTIGLDNPSLEWISGMVGDSITVGDSRYLRKTCDLIGMLEVFTELVYVILTVLGLITEKRTFKKKEVENVGWYIRKTEEKYSLLGQRFEAREYQEMIEEKNIHDFVECLKYELHRISMLFSRTCTS